MTSSVSATYIQIKKELTEAWGREPNMGETLSIEQYAKRVDEGETYKIVNKKVVFDTVEKDDIFD